ncbi:MAG: hypothetical protein KFW21_06235 [Spirochaetota bacterium]|nr:hypothetical protein [Spirochaetota bacterium]
MIKNKLLILLVIFIATVIPTHSVILKLTPFRLNQYVYYEILYKIRGIATTEFKNIKIIEENSSKLVFEFNDQRYTANNLVQGSIYVEMPEGFKDRYLIRSSVPSIILSQYDHNN